MERLKRLQSWLRENDGAGVIITNRKNIYYYSGFRGSNGLLAIDAEGRYELLTDFRYLTQAAVQAPDWPIRQSTLNLFTTLADFQGSKGGKWFFEGQFISFSDSQKLPKLDGRTYESCDLEPLRQIKSEEEIGKIRQAANIADKAFSELLGWIRPGVTEREVALFLDFAMMKSGAEKTSFATIVGSGPNGALPHAVPGERALTEGDLVVIDFGAVYDGYCSDETRTLAIGKATEEQKRIYQIVLKAQLAGLEAIRPGVSNLAVDRASRDIITEAGYGDRFGHGLGHGVGIEIHEDPRFSPQAAETFLKEQMVMTVEPGIYLPEWGGIRIEDLVVVRSGGCEILSTTTKDLLEIC